MRRTAYAADLPDNWTIDKTLDDYRETMLESNPIVSVAVEVIEADEGWIANIRCDREPALGAFDTEAEAVTEAIRAAGVGDGVVLGRADGSDAELVGVMESEPWEAGHGPADSVGTGGAD